MKLLQNLTKEELIEIIYDLKVKSFKDSETFGCLLSEISKLQEENYLLEKANMLFEEHIEQSKDLLKEKPKTTKGCDNKLGFFKRLLNFFKIN